MMNDAGEEGRGWVGVIDIFDRMDNRRATPQLTASVCRMARLLTATTLDWCSPPTLRLM